MQPLRGSVVNGLGLLPLEIEDDNESINGAEPYEPEIPQDGAGAGAGAAEVVPDGKEKPRNDSMDVSGSVLRVMDPSPFYPNALSGPTPMPAPAAAPLSLAERDARLFACKLEEWERVQNTKVGRRSSVTGELVEVKGRIEERRTLMRDSGINLSPFETLLLRIEVLTQGARIVSQNVWGTWWVNDVDPVLRNARLLIEISELIMQHPPVKNVLHAKLIEIKSAIERWKMPDDAANDMVRSVDAMLAVATSTSEDAWCEQVLALLKAIFQGYLALSEYTFKTPEGKSLGGHSKFKPAGVDNGAAVSNGAGSHYVPRVSPAALLAPVVAATRASLHDVAAAPGASRRQRLQATAMCAHAHAQAHLPTFAADVRDLKASVNGVPARMSVIAEENSEAVEDAPVAASAAAPGPSHSRSVPEPHDGLSPRAAHTATQWVPKNLYDRFDGQ